MKLPRVLCSVSLLVVISFWDTDGFQLPQKSPGVVSRQFHQHPLLQRRRSPPSSSSKEVGHNNVRYLQQAADGDTVVAGSKWGPLRPLLQVVMYVFRAFHLIQQTPATLARNKPADALATLPFNVFINRKSGGRAGKRLLEQLYSLVQPQHICDLLYEHPRTRLQPNTTAAIACGGDGTIRWIMDEARALNVSQQTSFGIIPMGTGNDLYNHLLQTYMATNRLLASRVAYALSTSNLITQTWNALQCFDTKSNSAIECKPFDRWQITSSIIKKSRRNRKLTPMTTSFNNYFGLGVDGDLTCAYDSLRKIRPHWFFHRLINKFWFVLLWIYKFVRGGAKDVSRHVDLFIDDVPVDISQMHLRGIILANICSYAGGTRLWSFANERKVIVGAADGKTDDESRWQEQSSEDGIIEVRTWSNCLLAIHLN